MYLFSMLKNIKMFQMALKVVFNILLYLFIFVLLYIFFKKYSSIFLKKYWLSPVIFISTNK